jgi:predicted GNAT family N-acyltransferase
MVHAGSHFRGIGKRLLVARLKLLSQQAGLTAVTIGTTPAVTGFFEKFGFTISNVEPNGYGPSLDHVEMILTLDKETRSRFLAEVP